MKFFINGVTQPFERFFARSFTIRSKNLQKTKNRKNKKDSEHLFEVFFYFLVKIIQQLIRLCKQRC